MKFRILFLLLSISGTQVFGQAEYAKIQGVYDSKMLYPKEVVPLTDAANGQFGLCLFRGKTINAYLFDKNHEIVHTLNFEDKQRSYKQIFGKTILKNGDYVVFMTNNRRKKFASIRLSFTSGEVDFHELELDFENEKIVQTAEYDNKFHVFTTVPKTSVLNVYRFDNERSYTKHRIDLSKEKFLDHRDRTVDLYEMLTVADGFYGLGKSVDLVKIEPNNPTSLEVASNVTKFYVQDDSIFLTFDQNSGVTQLLSIDLKNFDSKVYFIEKPFQDFRLRDKDGNSFLNGSTLFQIATTRETLKLRALKYRTGKLLKEHTTNSDEPIYFKNSSIVQTGGAFDNHREFENTDKLLRKVKQGKVSVAVSNTEDGMRVTFGGVIEIKQAAAMMPGFGFGVAGASIGAVTIFLNPAAYAYNSYTRTKALTVDGLFTSDFEHINGDVDANVFDKIEQFEEEHNLSTAGRAVFRMNDIYLLGSYDMYVQDYILWGFEN